jgi:surface antigen
MSRTRTITALGAAALALAAATPEAPAAPTAKLPYLDVFPTGQCTRWAYQRRPDIVDTGIQKYRIRAWDAWRWADNARRAGFRVDGRARRGDVAVWARNVSGAGRLGHVGYVESVATNGSVRISEADWNGHRRVTSRTLKRSALKRLKFIHAR